MAKKEEVFELMLKRGFIIPSSEVYGGIAGFFDYGHVGTLFKQKILSAWRSWCVRREGFVEIDGAVVVRKEVLVASGHVKGFVDPLVKCVKCAEAFRPDHLIEEQAKIRVEGLTISQMNSILEERKIKCPACGERLPGTIDAFHMIFPLSIGAGKKSVEGYLRPETAQTIFTDFPRIFKSTREKLPLGVAQVGRSFRNEISPRQGMVRMREFEQLEIEIFLDPEKIGEVTFWDELKGTKLTLAKPDGSEVSDSVESLLAAGLIPNKQIAYWLAKEQVFYLDALRIPGNVLRFRYLGPEETPFYSKGNIDMEVSTEYGWIETIGNAYRTDYDLGTHSAASGKDFSVTIDGRKFMPHVVEPSWGLPRMFYSAIEHAYRPAGAGREWAWLELPVGLAPYTVHVFPLMKKDGLDELARTVNNSLLRTGFDSLYDESGSIGKRYARADEIGVPFCITIDYESKEKGDATVRDRDKMTQERVKISELADFIRRKLAATAATTGTTGTG
jgi:glycyl-tRNA synthetase